MTSAMCWLWFFFWAGHGVITAVGYVFTGDVFNPMGLDGTRVGVATLMVIVSLTIIDYKESGGTR